MALVINTNVSSLRAQGNLQKTQSMLSKATADLSSGLKVNTATDNSAGYAIAQRFSTQEGGLQQAASNASDAVSLVQTAAAGLDQITSNLQAVRDLAVQAANGTYSQGDREALNTTAQQYLQEIGRTVAQTSYNGIHILDGSRSDLSFQVGADIGQSISVSLGKGLALDQLGAVAEVSTPGISGAFRDPAGGSLTMDLSRLTIDGVTLSGRVSSAQELADAINARNISASGGSVAAAVNGSGGVDIIQSGGGDLRLYDLGTVSENSVLAGATYDASTNVLSSGGLTNVFDMFNSVNGPTGTSVMVNDAMTGYVGGSLASDTADVLTSQHANVMIARIDEALHSVSTLASNLGAVQKRFQSAVADANAEVDNLASSRSTIVDADFATETAQLSKANVLQQAGISVLATANSQSSQILKLLQ